MTTVCVKTPFGYVEVTCTAQAVTHVEFVERGRESDPDKLQGVARQAFTQIRAYCQDADTAFDLPLQASGSPFQHKIWQALRRIPRGEVRTYGELAAKLKTSPRAVGNACRHNPIALVVPCHRVVSRQGIGGYSGATEGREIQRKRQLLQHEGLEIR